MRLKTDKRPEWLNKKIDFKKCRFLKDIFGRLKLNTVCQEAFCPNIAECFSEGVATFLILGRTCTRKCKFCAVHKGTPEDVDFDEPRRIKNAVQKLKLKHIVVTSVTRDDLPDGGGALFADCINEIRSLRSDAAIEVLVPDFKGNIDSVKKIMAANPDIFAHNIETAARLYEETRTGADYGRSLNILKAAKDINSTVYTKSGVMLGLGETVEDMLSVFQDLREAECDFLSIGQYLSPSPRHFHVKKYVPLSRFAFYKDYAEKLGFISVDSGPYVRSSYLAHRYIKKVQTGTHPS